MADETRSKRLQISNVIREITHVINDPFLCGSKISHTQGTLPFDPESVDGARLKQLLDDSTIFGAVTRSATRHAYLPGNPAKRPGSPISSSKQTKAIKLATYGDAEYPSSITESKIASPESSQKDQKHKTLEFDESNTHAMVSKADDDILSSNLSDLKILAIPEHYPTGPHSMSALAELYYLTQAFPLMKLLPGSHKALLSDNFELALLEGKIAVLYSRIEELKRQGRWSLRQPQRFYDPFVYKNRTNKQSYHLDNLMREGIWMAQDFRESLKLKKAVCVALAAAVQEYWREGNTLCVRRRPIVHLTDAEVLDRHLSGLFKSEEETIAGGSEIGDVSMEGDQSLESTEISVAAEEGENSSRHLTPQSIIEKALPDTHRANSSSLNSGLQNDAIDVALLLQPSSKNTDEACPESLPDYTAATPRSQSPFKLHVDLNDLKNLDQGVLKNLPLFSAFENENQHPRLPNPALKTPEAPLVPVSRLLYPFEDDLDWYKISLAKRDDINTPSLGPPEFQKGLFGFQSHRKFTPLKPPKPPLLKNIEYRMPTIWLPRDDKLLIHYVAEFCFNWELISEHLLSSSISLQKYESNIERRTPWQCFERYIQLNGKFQFLDMKGVYAYSAQKWLEQAHKAQLTTKRRISPLGVGKESIQRGHKRLRWASMFDAMRKCMKKREVGQTKVSHRKSPSESTSSEPSSRNHPGANGGAARNPAREAAPPINTEGNTPNAGEDSPTIGLSNRKRPANSVPNPAELSKLKFERDKTIQETYLNQQATRSRMVAAVAQQQRQSSGTDRTNTQVTSSESSQRNDASVGPHQRLGAGSHNQSPSGTLGDKMPPGQISQSGYPKNPEPGDQQQQIRLQQARSSPSIPTTSEGTPYTPEQIQQLLRLQKQKRLAQLQRQILLSLGSVNSPLQRDAVLIGSPQMNQPPLEYANNHSLQTDYPVRQAAPGSLNTMPSGPIPSSESNPSYHQPQISQKPRLHFAPAQVSAIINSIQTKNPNLTKEQVTKLAAQYLANIHQQQQQKASSQGAATPKPSHTSSGVPQALWTPSNQDEYGADSDPTRIGVNSQNSRSPQDPARPSGHKPFSGSPGPNAHTPSRDKL